MRSVLVEIALRVLVSEVEAKAMNRRMGWLWSLWCLVTGFLGMRFAGAADPFTTSNPYLLGVTEFGYQSQLLRIDAKTGYSKQIGSAPYKPIGKTSCLSKNQNKMFILGLNKTTANTSLLGFDTSTGDLVQEVVLPFSNILTNGKPNPTPTGLTCDEDGNLFVFGFEEAAGPFVGGFLDEESHELRNKITIDDSHGLSTYIHYTVATYSTALDEFIIGAVLHHPQQQFFAVNMKTGASREFSLGTFVEVTSLQSNPKDGSILGTGVRFECPESNRNVSLVSLDTKSLEFSVQSSLQECQYYKGNIGPIAIAEDSIYWDDRTFLDKADINTGKNQALGRPGTLFSLEYMS
eukprot:gb/GECG01006143.1/.p1 GENE.gb/GECG01006143.1/~~gb/GECG01006143.1/.p1  ORF type:complete len:349 (+),score=40.00 gb/GECG01006143.1/:1-1047(+)